MKPVCEQNLHEGKIGIDKSLKLYAAKEHPNLWFSDKANTPGSKPLRNKSEPINQHNIRDNKRG